MLSDRDRLIELNKKSKLYAQEKADERGGLVCIDDEVDYLIANGVICPPCKVGDTVYVIYDGYVTTSVVLAIYIDREGGMFDLKIKCKDETTVGFKTVIDKDNYTFNAVFLTPEEAEQSLERSKSNA